MPLLLAATCLAEPSTWLGGSTQHGGKAHFEVVDGELVGTAVVQTPNSFLCTNQTYGDFVLEFEFKLDSRLNSGVQIRSQVSAEATTLKDVSGKPIQIPAGKVYGYQVEIDTDPEENRQWTAGIYEEGHRGWLFPGSLGGDKQAFSKQGQRLTKVDDWNRVRIEAVGPRMRTWLNGEPRADIIDGMSREGFIAFQVHSIGNKALAGTKNRWRNVRLTTIPANTLSPSEKQEGWELLFDGSSLTGWTSHRGGSAPTKGWTVANGVLSVEKGGGDLISSRTFKAFELTVEFRLSPGANSGIFYLTQEGVGKKGPVMGLEFQILDDLGHSDAKRGKDGNRTVGALYDLVSPPADKTPAPVRVWNHARVVTSADGRKVEHWLNGRKVVAYDRSSEDFRARRAASKFASPQHGADFGEWLEGAILLQDHGDRVDFRNIKVRKMGG